MRVNRQGEKIESERMFILKRSIWRVVFDILLSVLVVFTTILILSLILPANIFRVVDNNKLYILPLFIIFVLYRAYNYFGRLKTIYHIKYARISFSREVDEEIKKLKLSQSIIGNKHKLDVVEMKLELIKVFSPIPILMYWLALYGSSSLKIKQLFDKTVWYLDISTGLMMISVIVTIVFIYNVFAAYRSYKYIKSLISEEEQEYQKYVE